MDILKAELELAKWGKVCVWVKGISDREEPLQSDAVGGSTKSVREWARVSETLLPQCSARPSLTHAKHEAQLPLAFLLTRCLDSQVK